MARVIQILSLTIPLVPHRDDNPKTSTIRYVIGDDADPDVRAEGSITLEPDPAPEELVAVDAELRADLFARCTAKLRADGKLPPV